MGSHLEPAPVRFGSRGAHQLGFVLHRRLVDPRQSGGCRRAKKKKKAEPVDHALGRSRGGFASKVHLVCDGRGLPFAFKLSAGQCHESRYVESLMQSVKVFPPRGRPRWRPKPLAGDKGYSDPRVRRWLKRHGIVAVI